MSCNFATNRSMQLSELQEDFALNQPLRNIQNNLIQQISNHLQECNQCAVHLLFILRSKFEKKIQYYKFLISSEMIFSNQIMSQRLYRKRFIACARFEKLQQKLHYIIYESRVSTKSLPGVCEQDPETIHSRMTDLFLLSKPRWLARHRTGVRFNGSPDFLPGFLENHQNYADQANCWNYVFIQRVKKYLRLVQSLHGVRDETKTNSGLILNEYNEGEMASRAKDHYRYEKVRKYWNRRCGNDGCNVNYLMHKYGTDFNINQKKHWNLEYCKDDGIYANTIKHWDEREVKNKWYTCKGCTCMKYCSKRCQKVSWNYQNHRQHCKKIQKNPKMYF